MFFVLLGLIVYIIVVLQSLVIGIQSALGPTEHQLCQQFSLLLNRMFIFSHTPYTHCLQLCSNNFPEHWRVLSRGNPIEFSQMLLYATTHAAIR